MGICCNRMSVCLSVHPSQASIVPKQLDIGSHNQCCTIAQGLLFRCQISWRNSDGVIPNGGTKYRLGMLKLVILPVRLLLCMGISRRHVSVCHTPVLYQNNLGITHRVHPWLDAKCTVNFLLAIIELFLLAKFVEIGAF